MILVAGATGALGGAVARELLARGLPVRVLVRPGSDYGSLVEAGAQPVMGDLKDPDSLDRACSGVESVVTTANSAARGGTDTTDTVDRAGNRALIDAARDAGVNRFVFISALGAAEDSPADFLRAKAETESHLRASGLSWTVLQPNIFMDVWFPMLIGLPLREDRPVALVGRGDRRHAFVAMNDVVAFAVEALLRPEARDRTIVVAGPEARTWTEVVGAAGRILGRPIEIDYVPPGRPLPGLPEVVAALAAGFESYETVVDMTPATREFGVTLTPIDEFLARMLAPALNA